MVGRDIERDPTLGYKSREQAELAYWTYELERAEQAIERIRAKVAEYALKATLDVEDGLGDW